MRGKVNVFVYNKEVEEPGEEVICPYCNLEFKKDQEFINHVLENHAQELIKKSSKYQDAVNEWSLENIKAIVIKYNEGAPKTPPEGYTFIGSDDLTVREVFNTWGGLLGDEPDIPFVTVIVYRRLMKFYCPFCKVYFADRTECITHILKVHSQEILDLSERYKEAVKQYGIENIKAVMTAYGDEQKPITPEGYNIFGQENIAIAIRCCTKQSENVITVYVFYKPFVEARMFDWKTLLIFLGIGGLITLFAKEEK